MLGNGCCDGGAYKNDTSIYSNTGVCEWDAGDCKEVPKYSGYFVGDPNLIGSNRCDGGEYNTFECGWDGDDCVLVDNYPDCS